VFPAMRLHRVAGLDELVHDLGMLEGLFPPHKKRRLRVAVGFEDLAHR
jgi:hypothetical protein